MRHVGEVPQTSAASLADFRARAETGRRADTLLASLDDAAFERGLARLDVALAEQRDDPLAPVEDHLTLLVLA